MEGIHSRDCDCSRDGDNSEYRKHPVDGDCPKVLRIWTILGNATVLGIMTALGMVRLLEHVLLHCMMYDGIVNKTSLMQT